MRAQGVQFRLSTPRDDDALRTLLRDAALPTEDVDTGRQEYVLAIEGDRLVGSIGLEVAEKDGLVRSLAVRSDRRDQGLGAALTHRALALAALRGARTVYLLTTTAQDYAARRGFERVDRSQVPPLVSEHAQFRTLCPSTAVCMRRCIDRDPHLFPRDFLELQPNATV
jgi:amino-acid N-acetyltransferase